MKQGTLHTTDVTQWIRRVRETKCTVSLLLPLSLSLSVPLSLALGRCYLANKSTFHMEPMNASCESDSLPFISGLLVLFTRRLMYLHASLHQVTCTVLFAPCSLSTDLASEMRTHKLVHLSCDCPSCTWLERKSHRQVKCTRELASSCSPKQIAFLLALCPSFLPIVLSFSLLLVFFFTTSCCLLHVHTHHSSIVTGECLSLSLLQAV